MDEEQHGHDPRVGVRIIVGLSTPSNPAVATVTRVTMPLGPGGFERKNNCAVDLHASTRASENRRAKPINAEAIEAAALNAHYYGRDDPIVGMPCGQAIGGQECVVHSLASVQYKATRIPRGGGWARNGLSRDAYRIDPQMPMNA